MKGSFNIFYLLFMASSAKQGDIGRVRWIPDKSTVIRYTIFHSVFWHNMAGLAVKLVIGAYCFNSGVTS